MYIEKICRQNKNRFYFITRICILKMLNRIAKEDMLNSVFIRNFLNLSVLVYLLSVIINLTYSLNIPSSLEVNVTL